MNKARYDAVAITLHWVIALGILAQIGVGWWMASFHLPIHLKFVIYQLHKSVGITILFAVAARVLWRLTHRPPPLPATMPALERKAATGAHHLLYLAMLAIPFTGWAVVSLSPYNIPTVLYGLLPWPDLPWLSALADKAAIEPWAEDAHAWLAYGALGLVGLHALAALRHHFLLRDGMLRRMLPLFKE
ncbi:cytochrome b [Acidocella sp. KAb 2-4]|uniref:cytochrome b n=1 Tax=Acidocella sp. KAb 2-4 TaxID=2885158 RepID=UPI001D062B90|nr:cytochrome b [Acidocella sp. KAb 2-4]